MYSRVIHLPCYNIIVSLTNDGGGVIQSGLSCDESYRDATFEHNAAINGLESLILAHACAGIEITDPAYICGIEVAIDAIFNKHY